MKSFNFFRIGLVIIFVIVFDDEILGHAGIEISKFISPESLVDDGWNA